MTSTVKPIPEGYHSITPYLIIKGASEAIEFYKKAFGATELFRMAQPDGRVGHAEIKIGDSAIIWLTSFPRWDTRAPRQLAVRQSACCSMLKTSMRFTLRRSVPARRRTGRLKISFTATAAVALSIHSDTSGISPRTLKICRLKKCRNERRLHRAGSRNLNQPRWRLLSGRINWIHLGHRCFRFTHGCLPLHVRRERWLFEWNRVWLDRIRRRHSRITGIIWMRGRLVMRFVRSPWFIGFEVSQMLPPDKVKRSMGTRGPWSRKPIACCGHQL